MDKVGQAKPCPSDVSCVVHSALKLSAVAIRSVRAGSKDAAVLIVLVHLAFTKVPVTACICQKTIDSTGLARCIDHVYDEDTCFLFSPALALLLALGRQLFYSPTIQPAIPLQYLRSTSPPFSFTILTL